MSVLGIEPVNAGRLLAFANVEIDMGGIVITLQGVRVVRRPGELAAEAPMFRARRRLASRCGVAPELGSAIAKAVFEAYEGR
jgi:hypothetical protein